MARKPRSASTRHIDAPRGPNGKINHRKSKADQAPPRPYFAYAQRLRHHDPENAEILLIAAVMPDRRLHRRFSRETLMKAIKAAEDPRLGYALGVLWARGLLCPAPDGFESVDEKETREEEAEVLDKAGRIYAAQHYLVWRWQDSPCQEAPSHLSHLERTLDELGIKPPTELDPEQFEKDQLERKMKLGAVRHALLRAAPMGLALKIVDAICIDGFMGEVHPGARKHLLTGLRTVKEQYNVRLEKSRDRSAGQDPAPMPPSPEQAAAPKRNRRPRLPANLTSDPTLRPPPQSVAASVESLLKEGNRVPPPENQRAFDSV